MLIIINKYVISTIQSNLSSRKGEGDKKASHEMCNPSKNATGGARERRWVDCLNDFKFNPFRLHKRASHTKHRFFTLVQSRRTRLCTSFERVTGHNYIILISIVSKFPHCLVTKSIL